VFLYSFYCGFLSSFGFSFLHTSYRFASFLPVFVSLFPLFELFIIFYCYHPDVFSPSIPRVSSVKTHFSLDVPQTWFNSWPYDDSLSRNMSPL